MHLNKGSVKHSAPQINRGRSTAPNVQTTGMDTPHQNGRSQRPATSHGRGDKDAAKVRKGGQARAHKQKLTDDDFDYEDGDDEVEVVVGTYVDLTTSATSPDSPQDEKRKPSGEIRMSDLPVKVQKQKGDDYVMISDVNKVVVLEDSTNQLDGPGVDGWEYIRRGEQDGLAISYAQVVATPANK